MRKRYGTIAKNETWGESPACARVMIPLLLLAYASALPAPVQAAGEGATSAEQPAMPDVGPDPKIGSPNVQSLQAKARSVVAKMSLAEKASQIKAQTPAIARLSLPAYDWWSEGLHGVARAGEATVFPQAIGLAATFDAPLVGQTADTIASEFRAKYRATLGADGGSTRYHGLTVWSPNINIFRDPRWGRGQETFGEDPYLSGRMGTAFVEGLQGADPVFYKTAAVVKHFAVHSGPESDRHRDDIHPTPYDLEDTYLPAFREVVTKARPSGVMCAYNAINGVPACATSLLAERLRGDWGFAGHVVSDCAAIADFFSDAGHAWSPDAPRAVASAITAGTDLFCLEFGPAKSSDSEIIVDAVRQGLLAEAALDQAVVRTLTDRLRIGLPGDGNAERSPYAVIPATQNDTAEHAGLNLRVARESLVLLKNEGLLPLVTSPRSIAVIGPNADSVDALVGNYNGTPSHPVTILAGLRQRFPSAQIRYVEGTGHVGPPHRPVPASVLCADRTCSHKGVILEEFAGESLHGAPARKATVDVIRFAWGSPVRAERDSTVRWSGWITPDVTSNYHFRLNVDDGYRIMLDGREIADAWDPADPPSIHNDGANLVGGKTYRIVVEAGQRGNRGDQTLMWSDLRDQQDAALAAAKEADLIIFAAGLNARLEGEEMRVNAPGFAGGDRTSLDLPAPQQALLESLHATGKPVVLLLMNGSALGVNWAKANLPAIIEAWYPGGVGGQAVAELIAGDFSPAGRLPVTFYASTDQLPPFKDYGMAGRTYRYFDKEPLYPFGYGLSFTQFAYSRPEPARARIIAGDEVEVSTTVTNTGERDSDEVVQLYVRHSGAALDGAPLARHALRGFQRIHLAPGESRQVRFTLDARAQSLVDDDGGRAVRPGRMAIWIGGGQPDSGAVGAWSAVTLTGKPRPLPR